MLFLVSLLNYLVKKTVFLSLVTWWRIIKRILFCLMRIFQMMLKSLRVFSRRWLENMIYLVNSKIQIFIMKWYRLNDLILLKDIQQIWILYNGCNQFFCRQEKGLALVGMWDGWSRMCLQILWRLGNTTLNRIFKNDYIQDKQWSKLCVLW